MSDNPNFVPTFSSDEVYFGTDLLSCLTDVVENKATINHIHDGYAIKTHTHNEYAVQSDLKLLESNIVSKADNIHTHTSAEVGASPAFTNASGGVEYSYGSGNTVNLLSEIGKMPTGMHTIYSIAGTTGNPKATESWRVLVHKTSVTIGWMIAFSPSGSVYTNYQDAANTFRGWKCIYESTKDIILWKGIAYMHSPNSVPQVITPSKKLSECRTGWLLLWSDYDPDTGTVNDSDFSTTYIPKFNPDGGAWGGKAFLCNIPAYVGGNANDISTEVRIIKPIYVHDDCIKGSFQNTSGGRNDVVLRCIYEV